MNKATVAHFVKWLAMPEQCLRSDDVGAIARDVSRNGAGRLDVPENLDRVVEARLAYKAAQAGRPAKSPGGRTWKTAPISARPAAKARRAR